MSGKKRVQKMVQEADQTLRRNPMVSMVYFLLRFAVIAVMVAQFFNGNFENMFLCMLTLALFFMPTLLEQKLRIDLPDLLEVLILLFIFAAEILGEIQAFYTTFRSWDTILHTINGFLCAAIGFSLVDLLNRNNRVSLSPFFLAIVAFCFSMTIGVLWEFFEYTMDFWFQFDMQKDAVVHRISSVMLDPANSNRVVLLDDITDVIVVAGGEEISLGIGGYLDVGLVDTMKDLWVNVIGAVVFSVLGYFYVKNRGNGWIASWFIPRVLKRENSRPKE